MTTLLFCKPFRVLSQFRSDGDKRTLADFIDVPGVYPAGRLDYDSEGLLLLTSDGDLQHRISHPRHKLAKRYWVQVEGNIDTPALMRLRDGVLLNDGVTAPAKARCIETPALWERDPPVRYRANIPTSWLELEIQEGRNRQVRRMTAAVGFPTLRLVRAGIGPLTLDPLGPGQWREIDVACELADSLRPAPAPKSSRPHRQHPHKSSRPERRGRPQKPQ